MQNLDFQIMCCQMQNYLFTLMLRLERQNFTATFLNLEKNVSTLHYNFSIIDITMMDITIATISNLWSVPKVKIFCTHCVTTISSIIKYQNLCCNLLSHLQIRNCQQLHISVYSKYLVIERICYLQPYNLFSSFIHLLKVPLFCKLPRFYTKA